MLEVVLLILKYGNFWDTLYNRVGLNNANSAFVFNYT